LRGEKRQGGKPRKQQDVQAPTENRTVNFPCRSLQFETPLELEYPEVFVEEH
jgi:hypothetical protein